MCAPIRDAREAFGTMRDTFTRSSLRVAGDYSCSRCRSRYGLSVRVVLAPYVRADHPRHQHGQEQLPADAFDDGQASGEVAARDDVAVAQGGQRDEAEIDRARPGEFAGGGEEGGRPELLEDPVEETQEDSREQVRAERRIQVFRMDGPAAHGEAQGAG